jgi:hypothetical protein
LLIDEMKGGIISRFVVVIFQVCFVLYYAGIIGTCMDGCCED